MDERRRGKSLAKKGTNPDINYYLTESSRSTAESIPGAQKRRANGLIGIDSL
jgi:hypothetical protein